MSLRRTQLKPSSERLDATRSDTVEDVVMGLYHRYAYDVASRSVRPGDRVLDVGFGEGYGSAILGGDYTGVELYPELVAHARSRYAGRFDVYDGLHLPDGPFDLAVSFQVIEHVRDPDPWLAEIARVARRAMLATPNRVHRLEDGERPWNRYHVREFDGDELREVLERHFRHVTVFGVRAPVEVEAVELKRFARARRVARLDPFGLRYRLPTSMDAWVRARLRRPAKGALGDVSLQDFRHSEDWAEGGLVLLADVS
jgi:SAM-dependent methyltransferase